AVLPHGVADAAAGLRQRAELLAAEAPEPELLLWALSIVWSRAFRLRGGGGAGAVKETVEAVAALVPLCDAFNHSDSSEELLTSQGFDGFDYYVSTRQSVGEKTTAVNICYRAGATDAGLLLQYGFCLEENRHAEAQITIAGLCLVIITRDAVGVLPYQRMLRLDVSADDWKSAAQDVDAVDEPTAEEASSWEALLPALLGGSVADVPAALRALEESLRTAERDLESSPSAAEHDLGPLAEHVLRLRSTTRLLLRVARGRLPWLLQS
ncbi:unnamed protein product, partial [Polarella glacialis]